MSDQRTDNREVLTEEIEALQACSARRAYLLSAVGHDLKNPLFGICLQAEVAEQSLDGQTHGAVREALSNILKCGRQATVLLERYLELGRLSRLEDENIQLEPIDLPDLLERIAQRAAACSDQNIGVQSVEPSQIKADPQRLEHILIWLLDMLMTGTSTCDVRIDAKQNESRTAIILEAIQPTADPVDEPPQLGDDRRKNLSQMGMIMARRLADQMGGSIDTEDRDGTPVRVTVAVPITPVEQGVTSASRVDG